MQFYTNCAVLDLPDSEKRFCGWKNFHSQTFESLFLPGTQNNSCQVKSSITHQVKFALPAPPPYLRIFFRFAKVQLISSPKKP